VCSSDLIESSERLGDTVEFRAGGEEYIISGKVTLEGGSPLAGVSISHTTTNANGEYSFIVSKYSSVVLTPSLSGYTFTPPSITCSNITANIPNQNFTAKTVSVVETRLIASLRIYPNPTDGKLTITNYELRDGEADYTIYSVVGQTVLQGKLSCMDAACRVHTINVEPLAKGMYFLRVGDKTVKFVKN
jgi:hypothetical protein